MKRPLAKKILITAAVYLALWALTWVCAPRMLERQLFREASTDWQQYHAGQEKKKELYPGSNEMMAFAKGPRVNVALLSCPAPFVIIAKCGTVIGGLNGYGTIGRYLFTPWHIYVISEERTWIS